jgi:uncharacterized coiled-coil DUF342 family protein
MNFNDNIEEILAKIDKLEGEVNSSNSKNGLLKWIQDIDELNKEVALKNECTKVYSGNLEKEADDIEKSIQTQLMAQQKIKEVCKELKNDINEIDSIRNKTEKNHEGRMQKIQKNYNEVRKNF